MSDASAPGVGVVIDARGVATLTVSHPGKLNILNTPLMAEIIAAVDALAVRAELRAVVLRGAGDAAFIGGADIREMARLKPGNAGGFITRLHEVCAALRRLPVPVVARVDGYALGAGLEIAAACDLRIASLRARFAMPEVKIGIPSVIEAALLPGLIGWGRTRYLLYTGAMIDAVTAERWGLVEQAVPAERLDETVETLLAQLLAADREALRLQKELCRHWEDHGTSAAIERGIASFAAAWGSPAPSRLMGEFLSAKPRRPAGDD